MCRTALILAATLLVAGAVIAQDEPPQPAKSAIRPMELYKAKGRAWTHRVTEWERGGKARTGNSRGKITESDGVIATYTSNLTWEDGSGGGGSKGQVEVSDMDEDQKAWADAKLPEETLEAGGVKWQCRRHVAKAEGIETTTWVSSEYHPLIVKQVKLGKDYCRIEKLTSFESAELDPYGLYRIAGRSWLTRNTTRIEGMDPIVSHTRWTVKECTPDGATLTMLMLDKDKKPMAGMDASDVTVPFKAASAEAAPEGDAPVLAREKKKCEAGEFDCWLSDVAGTKSWSSVNFPGLVVCIEYASGEIELIEFDLGHDPRRLYRTAGNYYVSSTTHSFGGMQTRNSMRIEVSSVKDGKATYTTTSYDENGTEQFNNESTMRVPEPGTPMMPYTNQLEETISTPAGTFRCIRSDGGNGMVSWSWHGIVIRLTLENKQMTMHQEVTELKVE